MRIQSKLAVIAGIMALGVSPAVALGAAGGHPNRSTTRPTGAGGPANGKAYGRFCQGESKQDVAGTPGTPFSKCVTDMAKLAHSSRPNPARACQNESKKRVSGELRTPYSICVSGAKNLERKQSGG